MMATYSSFQRGAILRLFEVLPTINQNERDLLIHLGESLENHREKCISSHPEFAEVLDQAAGILKNNMDVKAFIIRGDDHLVGCFTIRLGDPMEPVQVNVFAYPAKEKQPEHRLLGDLFTWKNNQIVRREHESYYLYHKIIDSVLANGGVFAAN